MQAILRIFPGVVGATAAFGVVRFFSWTELGVEFGIFVLTYLTATLVVDRSMKSYRG